MANASDGVEHESQTKDIRKPWEGTNYIPSKNSAQIECHSEIGRPESVRPGVKIVSKRCT